MKRLFLIFTSLVAMIFIIGVSDASAQYTYKFCDSLGIYEVKFRPHNPDTRFSISHTKPLLPGTHDFRFSLAWGSLNGWGENINTSESMGQFVDFVNYYPSNDHYYTFNLDYGYWAKEWLSVGGNVTWVMGVCNVYENGTHKRVDRLRQDFVSVMPTFRFAWLRRGVVQMYSSIGLGLGVERYRASYAGSDKVYRTNYYCAFDLKFLGLSVGRKWFGFMELGYGSRGIINAGFGYRFNAKTK